MEESAIEVFQLYKNNEIKHYELCHEEFKKDWISFLKAYVDVLKTTNEQHREVAFSFINKFEYHCKLRRYVSWLIKCLIETNRYSEEYEMYHENAKCDQVVEGDLIYEIFSVHIFIRSTI